MGPSIMTLKSCVEKGEANTTQWIFVKIYIDKWLVCDLRDRFLNNDHDFSAIQKGIASGSVLHSLSEIHQLLTHKGIVHSCKYEQFFPFLHVEFEWFWFD